MEICDQRAGTGTETAQKCLNTSAQSLGLACGMARNLGAAEAMGDIPGQRIQGGIFIFQDCQEHVILTAPYRLEHGCHVFFWLGFGLLCVVF